LPRTPSSWLAKGDLAGSLARGTEPALRWLRRSRFRFWFRRGSSRAASGATAATAVAEVVGVAAAAAAIRGIRTWKGTELVAVRVGDAAVASHAARHRGGVATPVGRAIVGTTDVGEPGVRRVVLGVRRRGSAGATGAVARVGADLRARGSLNLKQVAELVGGATTRAIHRKVRRRAQGVTGAGHASRITPTPRVLCAPSITSMRSAAASREHRKAQCCHARPTHAASAESPGE
jgi:hypothetical protein